MKAQDRYHIPVMLEEVIEALEIIPDGVYVDATFGGGGHATAILKRLNANGRLIAFDQDRDAKANLPNDSRILFIPHNFRHISRLLRLHKIGKVHGILADLGISSFQIDTPSRGFSTRFEGDLNMRMDQAEMNTAADVLNQYGQDDLQKILQDYGEVTNAKTLAVSIIASRKIKPYKTLSDLNAVLKPLAKGNPQRYFAQVYQAIRIEVNQELDALKELLAQAPGLLADKGRIVIITFHSLEDRMVKNFFKSGNAAGIRNTDNFGNSEPLTLKVISKKPVLPSENEIRNNPRSRSAKLRIAEKISSNDSR